MRSIRRSLILYFLVLLGLALGTVAVLMDRYAADFSQAREAAEAKRIETEYVVSREEIEAKFNDRLEKQADDLGKSLRWKYYVLSLQEWEERRRAWDRDRERSREQRDRERDFEEKDRRARLTRAFGPLAGVGGTPWLGVIQNSDSATRGIRERLLWLLQMHQNDEIVRRSFAEGDDHPKYFLFQFPPRLGRVIRGPHATADQPLLTPEELTGPSAIYPRTSDVSVGGVVLRRVVVKSPFGGSPFRGWLSELTRPPGVLAVVGSAPAAVPLSVQLDRGADPLAFVYVQTARPKAELDELLAVPAAKRSDELSALAHETRSATARLRSSLAVVAALTFIALAVGAWLLVGRGVAPLRKLSDAVSRVTERDIRLPVDKADLSRELVPIHDRLTHTLAALRKAFEREKQAVADISHELRTPVAALLTTLDVSLRKPRTAEQYRQTMEESRTITRQLGQLVERVMTLAYLDAGQTSLTRSRVAVGELADGCATLIRPLAAARGLTFTLAADPAVELDTDRDKLREVLMNLLHNAVEYSNPGGSVELAVRPNGGGRVAFDVRDTGIGMSDDVKGKIFERFYRADPSRTETGVHAGLGLAIVKEYVDRLGGTITVESAPGKGSLFRIEVPTLAT